MTEKQGTIFWRAEDSDDQMTDDLGEAIGSYIERFKEGDEPETITCTPYRQVAVSINDCADVLDAVLENLDEKFGGEDRTEPTEKMREAQRAFFAAVVEEYEPWLCRPANDMPAEVIDVRQWLEENPWG